MAEHRGAKLNQLENDLPEGLVVDASWLSGRGYSTSLISAYLKTGRLHQPVSPLYQRKERGRLTWQQVVVSLQTILEYPLIVGGRTALELQGYAHYLTSEAQEVHLYGSVKGPTWLNRLPLKTRFIVHNSRSLFSSLPVTRGLAALSWNVEANTGRDVTSFRGGTVEQPWGQWDWPLTLSTPERAVLQLLDELPGKESFHQVDVLFEGLTNLRPRLLQELLEDCRSIKVRRLFFFYAARHNHAWLKRLDRTRISLGSGKRMLVRGGRLDHAMQITVPEEMYGLQ